MSYSAETIPILKTKDGVATGDVSQNRNNDMIIQNMESGSGTMQLNSELNMKKIKQHYQQQSSWRSPQQN